MYMRPCVCPLKVSLFLIPAIKSHWPSKPDSLRAPLSIARHSAWEAWCRAQNFHSLKSLCNVILFQFVDHQGDMGFDFIMIVPLLLSHWSFFFVFECGVTFLAGSSEVFVVIVAAGCSLVSCDFDVSIRGAVMSFYSGIFRSYSCYVWRKWFLEMEVTPCEDAMKIVEWQHRIYTTISCY